MNKIIIICLLIVIILISGCVGDTRLDNQIDVLHTEINENGDNLVLMNENIINIQENLITMQTNIINNCK